MSAAAVAAAPSILAPSLPVAAVPAGFRSDLPRWQQLVPCAWLRDLVTGRPTDPPLPLPAASSDVAAASSSWLLFEVGWNGLAAFAEAHIPSARYLETLSFESEPLWNARENSVLSEVALANGITADTVVILYGRDQLAAARVAHLLLYLGVRDVRMLDGTFDAWTSAGLPVETGAATSSVPVESFGCVVPARPELMIDLAGAKSLLARPRSEAALVSIRSRAEFDGVTSGYSYISARGCIPGALWGRAGNDGCSSNMAAYVDAQGRMKSAAEIKAMWSEQGIKPEMDLAFYCGTGWRASLAFWFAWLMGFPRIAVYDGGWHEWSQQVKQ